MKFEMMVKRLRTEPLDSRKATLPIYDLCTDAADAIENLTTENTALRRQIGNLTSAQAVMVKEFEEKLEELGQAKSLLESYQATGMGPEDIEALKAIHGLPAGEIARMCNLYRAEQYGRVIVLPCRLGDTVWMIVTRRPKITSPTFSFVKESTLSWYNMERVWQDFGKTVFLTREEAELAQEGGKDHA